jgi:hypothetical protein
MLDAEPVDSQKVPVEIDKVIKARGVTENDVQHTIEIGFLPLLICYVFV